MILSPEAASAEATRLDREAREHKRLARYHRWQARLRRERLSALVSECQRQGIPVAIAGKAEADDRRTLIRRD